MFKKRRLFRRRTTWDVAKDNVHVLVTAFALIATAFAWTNVSSDHTPPITTASAEPATASSAAPERQLIIEEEAPPPAALPDERPVPASLTIASAQPAPPPASQVLPAPRIVATTPDAAPPSRAADTIKPARKDRRATRLVQSPRANITAHQTHHQRAPKGDAKQSYRDPFSCAVRKHQPCF